MRFIACNALPPRRVRLDAVTAAAYERHVAMTGSARVIDA